MSAAIYAQRAKLQTVVMERQPFGGGQILNTYEVDNYPGIPGCGGFELGMKLRDHAESMGTVFLQEEVTAVEIREDGSKTVHTGQNSYDTRTVIWAAGAEHRKLGIPGEEEFQGKGVSYCATCDGAFFRGKTVAVVGGGNVALEDALFLARGCSRVYLILRRDVFRGARILQEKVLNTENITVIYNTQVEKISGTTAVEELVLHHKEQEERENLPVQGIFIAVGITPNTKLLQNHVKLDENGYVIADESGVTEIPGLFVAGDARTKQLRQVVTAVSDGANCVTSVERYLAML
ncbi:MAG: FAD-dependent oxidoreductase [Eubacterium sp.]